jgi:hypothetical protein
MECPCNGCNERKLGCHSDCPKTPSYAEWKQWSDDRTAINKAIINDRREYLHSLEWANKVKRRKR